MDLGEMFSAAIPGTNWLAAGMDVLGGLMGQEFASDEASAARDFQMNMSNTAYQRATADMRAAGLNPMLAYQHGGASTPGGAMAATPGKPFSGQTIATAAQVSNIDADTELKKAEAARIRGRTEPEIGKLRQEISTSESQARQLEEAARHHRASAEQASAMVTQIQKTVELLQQQTSEVGQRVRANIPEVQRLLKDLQVIEAKLRQPGLYNQQAAQESLTGLLGAYLRALVPISGHIGVSGSHRD